MCLLFPFARRRVDGCLLGVNVATLEAGSFIVPQGVLKTFPSSHYIFNTLNISFFFLRASLWLESVAQCVDFISSLLPIKCFFDFSPRVHMTCSIVTPNWAVDYLSVFHPKSLCSDYCSGIEFEFNLRLTRFELSSSPISHLIWYWGNSKECYSGFTGHFVLSTDFYTSS